MAARLNVPKISRAAGEALTTLKTMLKASPEASTRLKVDMGDGTLAVAERVVTREGTMDITSVHYHSQEKMG